MFVNCTPHSINLRFVNEEIVEIPPTSDEELMTLFRCESFAEQQPNFQLKGMPELRVTSPPTYSFNKDLFRKVFSKVDKEVEMVFLMSTISGLAWGQSGLHAPPNCRFMVPYSGPDQTKCLREKGSIVWVAELIDYT